MNNLIAPTLTREENNEKKRVKTKKAYRNDTDGYRTRQLKSKNDRYHNNAEHREAHKKACRERYIKMPKKEITISKFIVDHYTQNYKATLWALNHLIGTTATFNGEYRNAMECCQLIVETDKTEEELDHWLYSRNNIGEYIGVVAY